ncbi:DUF4386 domain-containing protein [Arthrobacter sp. FW305-BF8]|uniref:DUF4386 domain-containing protein n=1 Tax=Arthrobacter sp. FW305-BF8 TaxID=2879617 RepID=UPI001F269513|nr:DUF4386 domain-containing protein [Arthrobacter sp. FW305-BF8]UKA54585.1 DUF4386 domain-containing protein [Arthrobacter sp. FW305-BF8]
MNATVAAGIMLIVLPVAFNAAFAALAAKFDYPDILRRPTQEVLLRFRDGGPGLVLLWWSFALTAVLLAPAAVLLSGALAGADTTLLALGSAVGVLAAVVQFLGLIRWPFLVPYLARTATEPDATAARKEAVDVVFQSFNRYLGVAVGEHLGYLLSGAWSILAGVAMIQSIAVPAWLGIVGIIVGAVLAVCSLEFVGSFEPGGWKLAAALTPATYIAWSLWLVAAGVFLLL